MMTTTIWGMMARTTIMFTNMHFIAIVEDTIAVFTHLRPSFPDVFDRPFLQCTTFSNG